MKKKYWIRNGPKEPRRAWMTVENSANADDPAHIHLDGQIGASYYDDSGNTSAKFKEAMDEIPAGKKIHIHVNSEGGSVQDGLGIYNCIAGRADDCVACIDGYALSIASIIPLAAGKVVSPKSSIWMMHNASALTFGNSEEHRKSADMLQKHDETLVNLYHDRTGKSKKEIRDCMDAETWMTGDEAIDFGLADSDGSEMGVKDCLLPVLDFTKYKNIPSGKFTFAVNQLISPPTDGAGGKQTVADAPGNRDNLMDKTKILALLKTHGIEVAADADEKTILDALAKIPTAKKDDGTAEAVAKIQAQLDTERTTRITAEVNRLAENRIPNDEVQGWIARAVKDETIIASLAKLPVQIPGGSPMGVVTEGAANRFDAVLAMTDKKARYAALKAEWPKMHKEAMRRDSNRGSAQNANTYSGTLITSFLLDGSLTDLQNRWAPLKAFSMDFSTDPYKPLATAELKHVTVGATAQTDATNFESGDSTVAPIGVTMHQYTVSFQVSNSDLNSGLRMENLVIINSANFANKVIEVATVPLTTVNYTNGPVVSSAAAFSFDALAQLQAFLKKSPIKNLILDGAYVARIANTPGFFQAAGVVGGSTGAWKAFGWDMIAQNSDWTGAGANVQGFACNPQALVGVTGLPLTPPNIPGGILSESTMTVPELEIPIAVYNWFNPSTRTMWYSYDIMAGFAAGDKTAGTLVTSA